MYGVPHIPCLDTISVVPVDHFLISRIPLSAPLNAPVTTRDPFSSLKKVNADDEP